MMKSKTKYLATILFMLTVNIIWSVLYLVNRQNGANEIISKTHENNYLKGKTENLNSAISLTFSADFRHQIESWIKQRGNIINKKEGLNLCCYYNSNVCKPCILSVMQDINSISIELGFSNLLVFSNVAKSNVTIRDLVWPTDVIVVKDFPAFKDGIFDLLLFVFEPRSGIREVYNPQVLPDFQQEYFQNIRKEIKFRHHSPFSKKVH